MSEPLLFELSTPGRTAFTLPSLDVPATPLPEGYLRTDLPLPEVSELELVRHFTRLSQLNYCIDTNFYPLGSCTMKYNPKVNEKAAAIEGLTQVHPLQPEEALQGSLELMYRLQEALKEIAGFAGVSLQPAAGAHGELAGVLMIRAYHRSRGEHQRRKILIPDSAHGTNPASSAMAGLTVVQLPSDKRGNVDLAALKQACDDTVAGLMLTNPNTLGLFEEHVLEVCETVHACGGLMYGDGANLNALLGIARPGDLGFDVMHFNLHKTFSTPHGGGGPGSGPVGVSERLAPFLPGPIVVKEGERFRLHVPEKSIGRVRAFFGNYGMFIRAYTYIRMHGPEGLRAVAEHAVLNANYLKALVSPHFPVAVERTCMHEFVVHGDIPGTDVRALDVAKRLIDYGFHPPTNYFPLIVRDALMIEPTETESRQTLDAFAQALAAIAHEARTDPALLHEAPHTTPVSRLDEVKAARTPVLCYKG
ncbi:MAG: aminomethyl-transferring glycine dehydrogenase subunit GcvPB [Ardenticatenia bacterium]|jgi:glycine dehydrogenase subunit 2|nr:MAG: aminomethyl-transferring glycine dehydrogenase subunit GcvPB [Ardenticatenia bacterium]